MYKYVHLSIASRESFFTEVLKAFFKYKTFYR